MRTQRHSNSNNMVLCCYYVVDEASEGPHGDKESEIWNQKTRVIVLAF